MILDNERRKLLELQGEDRKVGVLIMVAPDALKLIDNEAKSSGFTRGDFLVACFVKVKDPEIPFD